MSVKNARSNAGGQEQFSPHICKGCGEQFQGVGEIYVSDLGNFIKFPVCTACQGSLGQERLTGIACQANPEVDPDLIAKHVINAFGAFEGFHS